MPRQNLLFDVLVRTLSLNSSQVDTITQSIKVAMDGILMMAGPGPAYHAIIGDEATFPLTQVSAPLQILTRSTSAALHLSSEQEQEE